MRENGRVVCVDDKFHPGIYQLYKELPKKDRIYTIRNVILGKNMKAEEGEVAVLLKELTNPVIPQISEHELAFNAERFREIEPPKGEEEELEEVNERELVEV